MNQAPGVQCKCGTFKGQLSDTAFQRHNHLVCYCHDCQAFARYVGASMTMNERGGTEIIQVACSDVTITEDQESLAAVRLSEGGLTRWYASCCDTPVGNAPGTGLPFIGLIHDCLQPADQIEKSFGSVTLIAFANKALGEDRVEPRGMPMGFIRFLLLALGAKFRGDGKRHAFFLPTGEPITNPAVLNDAERAPLYAE